MQQPDTRISHSRSTESSPPQTERITQIKGKILAHSLCSMVMAGIKGKSGPPGNQNAFRHGLAGISQRRTEGTFTPAERTIREEILTGLITDKGGEAQIGTAMRVLAEIIASDVSLLVTFNQAIDDVIKSNKKARYNPKALAQLDGYKRPLVSLYRGIPNGSKWRKSARLNRFRKSLKR